MDKNQFGKVAVIMGGDSSEREISLMSGQAVLQALLDENVDAFGIDCAPGNLQPLFEKPFDRAFIAMHGPWGETGELQGLLDSLRIPYTGSGVLGSSLSMDKHRTKLIWQALGLPTPPWRTVHDKASYLRAIDKIGLPVIVKPNFEGSSVGISILKKEPNKQNNQINIDLAFEKAQEFNTEIIVEKYIEGPELTIGIVNNKTYPTIKISTPRDFYDFDAKYLVDTTDYSFDTGLKPSQDKKLGELALKAFHSLNCSGWGRVDFMQDKKGNPWLIEINPIPGLTSTSLVPKAANKLNISFSELILKIVETSI